MEKFDVLRSTLNHIQQHETNPRILLFSDFSETFDKIKATITECGLVYGVLEGKPKEIEKTIKDYGKGDINVLLMNAKNYGAGLNLQMTSHLIMFHRMPDNRETQVIARALRFGQEKHVKIIYLINENESDKLVFYEDPDPEDTSDKSNKTISTAPDKHNRMGFNAPKFIHDVKTVSGLLSISNPKAIAGDVKFADLQEDSDEEEKQTKKVKLERLAV